MKKNIYSKISFCAVLLFLCTTFTSNAQIISSVTTTPAEPIPRNGAFSVTVQISNMPSQGTKKYLITVTCTECIPMATGTGTLQVGPNGTLGSIPISGSNPGAFISPNRPGTVAISVTAVGINNGDGCQPSCDFNAAPTLPVELASFEGVVNTESVSLNWQTSTELNNAKFIIETSTEGEVFNRIGEIAGAGTTTEAHTYQFSHQTPSAGANYYRLKQVDFDGTFAYSKVIAINAVGNDKIFAFPNPAKDQVNIQYDQSKGPAAFFLFDAMGRQINASVGGYPGYYEAKLPIDLPAGTYWLRVIRSGKVQTLPIVKE